MSLQRPRKERRVAGAETVEDATRPVSKRLRAAGPPGAAAREHARRHIDRLYEVSKLLTSFTSVEETVPDVLRLVTDALPLRSAILIEETDGPPRMTIWHAPHADPELVRAAEASAAETYSHLVPEGRSPSRELEKSWRLRPFFLNGSPMPDAGRAREKDFILLPLVTGHLPISGAFQVEPVDAIDAIDLAFVNGLANQLAIALERHNAWNDQVMLRARAEALAIENARLLVTAEAAVRARDDFISLASHELLSPITSLDIQVKLFRRGGEAARFSPEALEKGHALIQRQTAKLILLITKLFDATRLGKGQLDLEFADGVDLAAVVLDVVENLGPDATRARCEVSVVATESVVGRWDPLRLEQVVTNLLSNAIKYAAGGPIEVRVERKDGKAVLAVNDRGLGIAPMDHARIFTRFQRTAEARSYPGLGLGLCITREIVERHGGTIRVESELGEGATFTVELPLDAAPGMERKS